MEAENRLGLMELNIQENGVRIEPMVGAGSFMWMVTSMMVTGSMTKQMVTAYINM